MPLPETTTLEILLERYDSLLLDAYGVLLDKHGPLPGSIELIQRLNLEERGYLVVTNSASRLPESMAADFADMGLAIPPERILSSGMLLERIFADRQLEGAETLVLGPADAHEYVRRAGGCPRGPENCRDAEVVVLADQKGFDLQSGLDTTLTVMLRRFDRGAPTPLLLCNPDLIYPDSHDSYGFTSGALGAMLDHILAERYPDSAPSFEPLGKPYRPLFEAATSRVEGRMIMLGDQLTTDILGAKTFGIDAALVQTGLAVRVHADTRPLPDYLLPSLKS